MIRCLLLYDIPDDRVRTKVADFCLDYGLDRLQYSAFLGRLSANHQEELMLKIERKKSERPPPACISSLSARRTGANAWSSSRAWRRIDRCRSNSPAPTDAHASEHTGWLLKVTDLKQFAYCPRIPYYHYCLPEVRPTTYKMDAGIRAQDRAEELERRRSLRAYGLTEGERHFNVSLASDAQLGVSGQIDLVIKHTVDGEDRLVPGRLQAEPARARAPLQAAARLLCAVAGRAMAVAGGRWVPVSDSGATGRARTRHHPPAQRRPRQLVEIRTWSSPNGCRRFQPDSAAAV